MKKILLFAGVACMAAANASAFELNPYVSAKAKYAFARNEVKASGLYEDTLKYNDNIWGGSIAVGHTYYVMNGDFRLELEYTKNADAKKNNMKVKTQGLLFNVYYDFNLATSVPLKPYVGVGFGWGRSEFEGKRNSVKEDDAAVQIGTGVSYKFDEHTSVDLGYRYISYGDFDREFRIPGVAYEKVEYEPRAHELLLGIRYDF